jgi:hypothetical protein
MYTLYKAELPRLRALENAQSENYLALVIGVSLLLSCLTFLTSSFLIIAIGWFVSVPHWLHQLNVISLVGAIFTLLIIFVWKDHHQRER